MEFIEINGVRVQVPQDIVAQGRDAVATWAAQQSPTSAAASTFRSPAPARQE